MSHLSLLEQIRSNPIELTAAVVIVLSGIVSLRPSPKKTLKVAPKAKNHARSRIPETSSAIGSKKSIVNCTNNGRNSVQDPLPQELGGGACPTNLGSNTEDLSNGLQKQRPEHGEKGNRTPLPRLGDNVYFEDLAGSKLDLNGLEGIVDGFGEDKGRYEVLILDQEVKRENIKLENIRVAEDSIIEHKFKQGHNTHVLIPCHIESIRRLCLFKQCAKSVALQKYNDFNVLISLSGTPVLCKKAAAAISTLASTCENSRWYIQNNGNVEHCESQMEHIRSLVDLSSSIDPKALLLFLDNDDMMHPLRIRSFHDAMKTLGLPEGCPLPISCKLLLSEDMKAEEGQLERLISGPYDFHRWKKDHGLRRKIELAPSSKCKDMDCTEYFDFMVPSNVMQKFFSLNPPSVTSHRFCDLRLTAILEKLAPIETIDNPSVPWLLAHYKASMHSKYRMFDNHSELQGNHAFDQASISSPTGPSFQDDLLARKYPRLSAAQIQMIRGHFESLIIQYYGWDDKNLARARKQKVHEVNGWYGYGVGDEVWLQAEVAIGALFTSEISRKSREAWTCLIGNDHGEQCILM